jgi:hypothetical protein
MTREGGGRVVAPIDRPYLLYISVDFNKNFIKGPGSLTPKNDFELLKNSPCKLIESRYQCSKKHNSGRFSVEILHRKKKVREFPVPSRNVTTKLSLGGNNDVITELFLPRGSLVSEIPAGDGKLVNLFYGVSITGACTPLSS